MMPKVVFVILHYLTTEDTFQCVKSIKDNINYDNYHIVIVDNASYNDSFEELKNEYEFDEKIYLIKNEKNLGFAKGNNIGYSFAKNKFKASFIIVINNDTIIEDEFFISEIVSYYETYKFHILGPNIISLQDNIKQNPLNSIASSKAEIFNNIMRYFILYILNVLKVEDLIKKILIIKNKKVSRKQKNEKVINEYQNKEVFNVPLHGSCLIFSQLYIEKFDYAFYPNTFLYCEEDILFYLCKKHNLKTVYLPQVTIYHKEDSATDYLVGKGTKKRRFIYKNILKSSFEFYKLMNK